MSIKYMNDVWGSPFNASEKLTLMAIADCANDEGFAYPGYRKLQEKTGLAKATIAKCLHVLKGVGILKSESHASIGEGKKVNTYTISLRSELMISSNRELIDKIKELRKDKVNAISSNREPRKVQTVNSISSNREHETSVINTSKETSVKTYSENQNLSLVGKEPTHAGKKNGNDNLIDLPTELNIEAWGEFVEHRELIAKKKKTPFSELAQKKAINKLIKFEKKIQAEAIDKAIINGWTDVYPESVVGKKDPGGAAHTGSEHWVTTKSGKRIDLNNESCMVETNKGLKRLSEVKYSNGELRLC